MSRQGLFISIENGLLHLFHDEAYIFDFKHNQIYKSHNADFNQFLIRRASFSNMFVYKGFVYSYVPATQSFNLYPFKMSDFTLLKTGIWGNEKTIWTILYIIVGIVVFLIGLIALVNRIVKRKIVNYQPSFFCNRGSPDSINNECFFKRNYRRHSSN